MNLAELEIKSFSRLIAHEIHPKTKKEDAYAKTSSTYLKFDDRDTEILTNRLVEALTNTTKTFKLEFEDQSEDSIYSFLQKYEDIDDDSFIEYSKTFAEDLANAHFRLKIPGGFCLIGEGVTNNDENFFFVIKAELQEVFNIKENELHVIENVFLSPAKDFYKIGFFLKRGKSFIPFMYDDLFNLQKKDLTEYFYGKFLGLTTDRNDKLKSKNFYEDTKGFIEHFVNNLKDRLGLLKALDVLYREETSGIISPKDFSNKYLEGKLKTHFEQTIIQQKYPHSFTKDTSLLTNKLKLQRVSIPLSYSLALVGTQEKMDSVDVVEEPNAEFLNDLGVEINNGTIDKIVILRQKIEVESSDGEE
ncbi:hypothetical protein ACE01N_19805 [Saccharicrinis sp. FJH2]|uniref:hypothetical protein n=1 Tax=Saccharicrinis sp. FJH65 TaxID=3344659 RepID=UPI0035F3D13F